MWTKTAGFALLVSWIAVVAHARRPNIILMMADDLGYGDLSSFGNTTLRSANIDRLASEGVKLTHALATSAICTPSRAAFLTGRYPARSGMAPNGLASVLLTIAQPGGLPQSEITFAKMLKNAGYSTALIGKWHQGLNCWIVGDKCHHPHTHGFDFFYGLPHSNIAENKKGHYSPTAGLVVSYSWYIASGIAVSLATALWAFHRGHRLLGGAILLVGVLLPIYITVPFFLGRHLNGVIMRDDVVVEQPIIVKSLTRRLVRETLRFIAEKDNPKKPFLVFLSFTHVHGYLEVGSKFRGQSNHGVYGDAVLEMDWAVGEVMQALETRGIRNDTFVLFASDHGAHVEETEDSGDAGWNGPFSGGKGNYGMEGGIRVPLVISWPGHIAPGVVSVPVSLMDVFPTLAKVAEATLPTDRILDGHDLSPLIFGNQPSAATHRVLFHPCRANEVHAVTLVHNDSVVWKVHFKQPKWLPGTRRCKRICRCVDGNLNPLDKPLIYNIKDDPSETHPISSLNPQYQEIVTKAKNEVARYLASIEDVPAQLKIDAFLWRPWLQPWCSYPFSTCQEKDEDE